MANTTDRARRFMYNGMELTEPPAGEDGKPPTPDQVRQFWAGAGYADLGTAKVKGPTPDGDVDVYEFVRHVGVKG
jgi:PRTRC genetic system protein C